MDSITFSISPDYFVIAKGLHPGQGLYRRTLLLGLQAGSSGGILLGCGLLTAAHVGARPALPVHRLFRAMPWPGACGGAGAGSVAAWLAPGAHGPIVVVTATHWGVYVGAFTGALIAAGGLLRQRRLTDPVFERVGWK